MSEYRFTYDDWLNDRIKHPYGNDKSIAFLFMGTRKLFSVEDYKAVRKAQDDAFVMKCEMQFIVWRDALILKAVGHDYAELVELYDLEIDVCKQFLRKNDELYLKVKNGDKGDNTRLMGNTYQYMNKLITDFREGTYKRKPILSEYNLNIWAFTEHEMFYAKNMYLQWVKQERRKVAVNEELNKMSPSAPLEERTKLVITKLIDYNFDKFLQEKKYDKLKIYRYINDNYGPKPVPFIVAFLYEIKYLDYFNKEIARNLTDGFIKLAKVFNCSERTVAGNYRIIKGDGTKESSRYASDFHKTKIGKFLAEISKEKQ